MGKHKELSAQLIYGFFVCRFFEFWVVITTSFLTYRPTADCVTDLGLEFTTYVKHNCTHTTRSSSSHR